MEPLRFMDPIDGVLFGSNPNYRVGCMAIMVEQNKDDFIALQDYFDRIYQVSEIEDNLFTVDPTGGS